MHNPDCDAALGQPCDMRNGVRVLPLNGGSNLNVCRAHFMRELRFRESRNAGLHGRAQYELPTWESLRELREAEREPIPSRNEYECWREDDGTGYDECRWPACDCPPKEREPLPEYEGR